MKAKFQYVERGQTGFIIHAKSQEKNIEIEVDVKESDANNLGKFLLNQENFTAALYPGMMKLKGIIKELEKGRMGAVPLDEIISKAAESHIDKDTVEDYMQRLKTIGELLEVANGRFRVV